MLIAYPLDRNNTSLMDIHNIPRILEISDISIGKQRIFFIGVEQREVFHDDC